MKFLISIASAILSAFTVILTVVFVGGLFGLLTSCGTYEVPKTEVKESLGECGEGKRYCESEKPVSEDKEAGNEGEKEAEPDTEVTTEVSVSVEVKVSVKTTVKGQDTEKTKFIFDPVSKDWATHNENAPAGYRLATRAESIGAKDDGLLADIMDANTSFWTGSQSAQVGDMYWIVSELNEFEVMKTLDFPALFIAK